MKQEKCPKWLRMKWRKRVEAMALATALVVTGVSPITVQADEGVSEENVVVEDSVESEESNVSEASVETEEKSGSEHSDETEEKAETEESAEVEENVEPEKNGVSEENNVSVASEITVNSPVGLVLGSPRENVLEVVYGPCGMDGVARYVIYLDGKAIKEDAQVAFYTFENIEPGEHKVQVTAVLEDGSESDKSKCEAEIVVLGEVKEESSDEVTTTEEATTEEAAASEYMNFESATTSIYCGSDWAGATAEVEEDGDTAIIKASNFGGNGSNEWAIQYKIDGIDVIQGAEYTLSCDLLSDIDKKIVIKLDDAAGVIFETISLKAGEAYHFEKTSAPMPQAQTQLFFAPGTMGGDEPNQSGNITISKLKLTTQEVVEEPEEKPEDKPVVQTGDVIAISESKESATVGEDITLTFFENKDFSDAISEVLVNGQAVSFDKDSDSIDIDGSYFTSAGVYDIDVKADAFAEAGIFTIKVIADGYDYTQVNQTIISSVVSEDGNVVPEFSEWEHYVGSDWAYVESKIVDQDENNIELSVKANGGWADTAWGVQLVKADIPVTVGYPYTISFKAKAGQDKKFALKAEDANGKEMLYKEYSLKAGEEQTITVELDEMTTEFVKLYFALGVFADETNIDTTVTISDFEMCNTLGDGDEEPETPEEEEKPSQSTDKKQNQSDTSDKNDSEQNTTSSTSSATVNKVVRVEDKLANVIFDSAVPLTGTPTNPMSFTQALTNLDLGMERDTTIDYGEGFSSVTYIPNKPAKLGYEVTIHMGIGAEHAGNIAYTTNEYSYMVVLYQ